MNTGSLTAGPHSMARFGRVAAMAAALLICMAYGSVAAAMDASCAYAAGTSVSGTSVSGTSVLEAADHAELAADISMSGVVRIALPGDRVAKVIRAPGGLRVEHDPASGDLYLRPLGGDGAAAAGPEVLFIGTERGFTYRLALTPVSVGATQILIRNPAVVSPAPATASTSDRTAAAGDDRIGALVRLIRAAARGEPLAGYAVHAGRAVVGTSVPGTGVSGLKVIETWRGSRFSAFVFEAGPSASGGAEGAAGLAGTLVPETLVPETRVPETIGGLAGIGRLAALWLAAPGTGPSGGRLAVAVYEDARAGDTRAGDGPVADPPHAGESR